MEFHEVMLQKDLFSIIARTETSNYDLAAWRHLSSYDTEALQMLQHRFYWVQLLGRPNPQPGVGGGDTLCYIYDTN